MSLSWFLHSKPLEGIGTAMQWVSLDGMFSSGMVSVSSCLRKMVILAHSFFILKNFKSILLLKKTAWCIYLNWPARNILPRTLPSLSISMYFHFFPKMTWVISQSRSAGVFICKMRLERELTSLGWHGDREVVSQLSVLGDRKCSVSVRCCPSNSADRPHRLLLGPSGGSF